MENKYGNSGRSQTVNRAKILAAIDRQYYQHRPRRAKVVLYVDAGVQVDVAYFNFRKTFDTVEKDVLLNKLAKVGCTSHLLQFLFVVLCV